MAGGMKNLAKDTAIYGLSSILGKFINWLLVPFYTRLLTQVEYGVVTNMYGFVALLIVLLTYGMETGFFRFVNKEEENPKTVYSTTLISIAFTSVLFVLLCWFNLGSISDVMGYANHSDYVIVMAVTVAIDAFVSIPFAYLRYKKRPLRFATLRLLSIFLTIAFTLFFLLACPYIHKVNPDLIGWFYDPDYKVGYVFVANLLGSIITLILLLPEFTGFKYVLDKGLLKRMLKYSFPLLILGVAGVLNQTIDRIIYPSLFDDEQEAFSQLGVYGACFRIAVVMMMFTQAFRFAYEPFIFAKNKNLNDHKPYIEAMKYFVIFSLVIFLGVMFYIDIVKYFVGEDFLEGIKVVPIVMIGYIFFGIYFNLSFWYKMVDKTYFGAIFSLIGCAITVTIIVVFVPRYGYIASAWASLVCNLVMMVLSYIFEQKYHPIKYDLKKLGLYFAFALLLYALGNIWVEIDNMALRLLYRTALLGVFLLVIVKNDVPLSEIPVLNKLIRRK
ncbi:O-antigen/teichoic acid export membrane protein [Dysgonomonas sp. PH5-45]|uniref:lipopolysaccharide biosynthesis protein n=1 Tax=unclassified Dysgonomonas TaxID=2630389 RepID=UPI0024753F60|nr:MULTISPECIES: oligosaccharide flippase family protein [unclassified Dysgonomonas]MDH6355495.1 O-antigen/teichoic acid export membrane protein [Dysgonomonas sp. PH5-45]MDH6388391.1 O-antigen/teichoic acid export membrane protein [Dysgonomonas sp. PH5-37]